MKEIIADNELKKVYDLLESTTPLIKDCGKICGNKCCKGETSDGMLLFPGEEKLFDGREGFKVFYDDRYSCYAVTCNGSCDRKQRPLSCRIFPYFIYIKDEQSVPTVAPDIRASDYCPLLRKNKKINKKFLRAIRISAKILEKNDSIRSFLIHTTYLLTDFNSL